MAEHSAMLNAVVEALKLVGGADGSASGAGRSMLRMLYERTLGDSEAAQDVLAFVSGATQGTFKSATGAGAVGLFCYFNGLNRYFDGLNRAGWEGQSEKVNT